MYIARMAMLALCLNQHIVETLVLKMLMNGFCREERNWLSAA